MKSMPLCILLFVLVISETYARRVYDEMGQQTYRRRPHRYQEVDQGFMRNEVVGQERFRRQGRPNRKVPGPEPLQKRQGQQVLSRRQLQEQERYFQQQQQQQFQQKRPSAPKPQPQQLGGFNQNREQLKESRPVPQNFIDQQAQRQEQRPQRKIAKEQAERRVFEKQAQPDRQRPSEIQERVFETAPAEDTYNQLQSESAGRPQYTNQRPQRQTQYRPEAQDRSGSVGSYPPPPEQASIEKAVAAGANGYNADEYEEAKRLAFQIHGQEGPHSYRFGYDTGVGYNRQFRYESRDGNGVLQGRYGYYDQEGKLQIVNYRADPQTGFHADGDHVPKPQY